MAYAYIGKVAIVVSLLVPHMFTPSRPEGQDGKSKGSLLCAMSTVDEVKGVRSQEWSYGKSSKSTPSVIEF